MATIRLIRRRIKSAKNIAQITKAMELVAASKMRRAVASAAAGKLYAGKIYDMVMKLASKMDATNHPLMKRPVELSGKRLVILLSTNKGLCGGLNTNLFRFFLSQYPSLSTVAGVTLGKKGADFTARSGVAIAADFSSAKMVDSIPAVTEFIIAQFLNGSVDGVDLVYSEFISAMTQRPKKKTILPLQLASVASGENVARDFVIEPSIPEVFNALLPHYLENQIRDAVLQAEASEHSARMVAMRNARENAISMIGGLTLLYNKARQEKITYEITDMVTARLAVEV